MIANRLPTADFEFSPAAPKKNENVTFTSLASDPENRIQMLEWDLDGDNQYDDAFGPTAQNSFDTPGTKTVRLKVTDSDGGSHTAAKTHHGREPAAGRVVRLQPGDAAVAAGA